MATKKVRDGRKAKTKAKTKAKAKGNRGGGAKNRRTIDPIDLYVGARIQFRRTVLGLTQEELAKATGLTAQQLQKNERGKSHVTARRLFLLSRALDVPIQFFFDDMPDDFRKIGDRVAKGFLASPPKPPDDDPLARLETIKLVHHFFRVSSPKERKFIIELAESLADKSTE